MNQPSLSILAISGSLRASSANTAVLRAAISLAPDGVAIILYQGLADLPHYNPDIDDENASPAVTEFRRLIAAADGVLISCPEYAHGVPGSLKNALDWVVGSGEFMNKPVALINASPHSTWALASLTEILTVMSARIIGEAAVTLPIATNRIDEASVIEDPALSTPLANGLAIFLDSI